MFPTPLLLSGVEIIDPVDLKGCDLGLFPSLACQARHAEA